MSLTTSQYGTKANLEQKSGHEGIAGHQSLWIMARRPIWAKVGHEASWTTSKYGTKANIARHREPPVIIGKGRNHRPSWAKVGTTGHHGQKVGTTGHHGQKVRTTVIMGKRVGRAWDRWTTSYGMQANLGKGRLRKRSRTTSYDMKAILSKR